MESFLLQVSIWLVGLGHTGHLTPIIWWYTRKRSCSEFQPKYMGVYPSKSFCKCYSCLANFCNLPQRFHMLLSFSLNPNKSLLVLELANWSVQFWIALFVFLGNQQVSMIDCLVLATFFLFSHFKEELTSQSFSSFNILGQKYGKNTNFNSSQHYTRGNTAELLVSITISLRVCIKIVEPVWTGRTLAPSYPTTAIAEVLKYAQLTYLSLTNHNTQISEVTTTY